MVNCDGVENMIGRSGGRSLDICAAVCEYGFKSDPNGYPTYECSEPCGGFLCSSGSHCKVAKDLSCASFSGLCSTEPVCYPVLV